MEAIRSTLTVTLMLAVAVPLSAAEAEVVLEGLDNPWGVAVQPGTDHVFVSESGAGRVVRVRQDRIHEVIVGFPTGAMQLDPAYQVGPLGLAFLNENTLLVGEGGLAGGKDQVRVFQVPAEDADPLEADQAKAGWVLAPAEDAVGEGDFCGLAVSRYFVFAISRGDATQGWVSRARFQNERVSQLERFVATRTVTGVGAPSAITTSPRGEMVVGQMGDTATPGDSVLAFYNATNGQLLLHLAIGLHDISALAYSPKDQLYATDLAWQADGAGGLYQIVAALVDGRQVAQAKKIVSLDRPTAIAFAKDGSLYVTAMGMAGAGGDRKSGRLLKISLE
ncbi:MAG: hypothetical protein ACC628_10405 [Pirellulaceae bacterium]